MFDIAICDDCQRDCERLKKIIMESDAFNSNFRIHIFDSGEALLNAMENIRFSSVFLDIQMKSMDGDKTATEIRKMDSNLILVFYTGYAGPSPRSFTVKPFRYIIKNRREIEIINYVRDTLQEVVFLEQEPILEARIGKKKLFLKPDDIVFIEKYKRDTRAHLSKASKHIYKVEDQEIVRVPDALENIYKLLKQFGFGYPHDSYIINFKYVIHCTATNLSLSGESKEFSITRNKAPEFNKLKDIFLFAKYKEEE